MPEMQLLQLAKGAILTDPAIFPKPSPALFDPQHWQQQGAITGTAKGRGTTCFFHYKEQDFVLRHYRRGGLIGKLIADKYLYLGLSRTRPWREFELLQHMQTLGLPVPQVAAAQVQRQAFSYSADLIMQRIVAAEDLHKRILAQGIDEQTWRAVGQTICRFHDAQVYHHDLNIRNIMLDQQDKVWLIDFDKCTVRDGEGWKSQNLQRLQRSVEKELSGKCSATQRQHYWQCLLQGYEGG